MRLRVRAIALVLHVATVIWAQDPTVSSDTCNYADCGVTDVTPPLEINESPQRYRILSKFDETLYIGGLRKFIQINPACNKDGTDPWMTRSDEIKSCKRDASVGFTCSVLRKTNPTLVCDNYIRVAEEITSNKLLVCGTADAFPRCYSFNNTCNLVSDGGALNVDNVMCTDEKSYEGLKPNMIPRNQDQNGTFAKIGGSLFLGSSSDISFGKGYVGKFSVTRTIGNFDQGLYEENLKTDENQEGSVNTPSFVGRPYQYSNKDGDFVLFFFREYAYEHQNEGKIFYSRVARVCQNEVAENSTANKWFTYIKARLNCSLPALSSPKYFDEIQDFVPVTVGGEVYFYAVFNRPMNSPHQSAVCVYKLSDVHNTFQSGKYKINDKDKVFLQWGTFPTLPTEPQNCNPSDLESVSDFFQGYPIMSDLVPNYNYKKQESSSSDQPLLYSNGVRFSRIAVDKQNTLADNVIFIGTDAGQVWKVTDLNGSFHTITLWQSVNGSPITGLEFIVSDGKTYLYATTHENIIKIDLQYGHAQSQTQFNSIYPPYLSPSDYTIPTGVITSPTINQTFCYGQDVQMTCQGKLDPTTNLKADTQWLFTPEGEAQVEVTASGKGHFMTFNKITSEISNPLSYLQIKIHNDTVGSYQCVVFWGPNKVTEQESATNTLRGKNCVTSSSITDSKTTYTAANMDAVANKNAYNQMHPNIDIQFVTCEECPWN